MENESHLKKQLKKHLFGGEAFMPLEEILKKITFDQLGIRPKELPYSFYEIFYHISYTQQDILQYCQKPDYKAPSWPADYWPDHQAPKNPEAWEKSKDSYFETRAQLESLNLAKDKSLVNHVPSNKDHSIFREMLLVIEHTAYHSGQLVIILRHLGLHSS